MKLSSALNSTKAVKTLEFKEKWLNEGYTNVSNSILTNKTIPYQARYIYILLMMRVFNKDYCFPGLDAIGEQMNQMKRNQVSKYLKVLRTDRWLEVKRRGQGKTNMYYLIKH